MSNQRVIAQIKDFFKQSLNTALTDDGKEIFLSNFDKSSQCLESAHAVFLFEYLKREAELIMKFSKLRCKINNGAELRYGVGNPILDLLTSAGRYEVSEHFFEIIAN